MLALDDPSDIRINGEYASKRGELVIRRIL